MIKCKSQDCPGSVYLDEDGDLVCLLCARIMQLHKYPIPNPEWLGNRNRGSRYDGRRLGSKIYRR